MNIKVNDVIELIEKEKKVLNAVIKGIKNSKDELEDPERMLNRYEERVKECNRLILMFSELLIDNEEVK